VEAITRRTHERPTERLQAERRAREVYAAARPLRGGHPYLTDHGLGMHGCHTIRVDARGWLIVPGTRAGRVVTYQAISADGSKRYALRIFSGPEL